MKIIHCGSPLWSTVSTHTGTISYVFQSDDGKHEVEIVLFHGRQDDIFLYPHGIDASGTARTAGFACKELLSAQALAAELLGAA